MSTATITVPAALLRRAAGWAKPDSRTPIPVLANVRVTITGQQLVLAVYDWEACLLARVPGTATGAGQALVPAGGLADLIKMLPKDGQADVTIRDEPENLVPVLEVTARGCKGCVTQDADPAAYPAIPQPPPPAGFADAAQFGTALLRAAGCCATEKEQPLIRSIHLIPGDNSIELQATDKRILGMTRVPFTRNPAVTAPGSFLIPGPAAVRFLKAGTTGPVLAGGAGQLAMLSDGWHTLLTGTARPEDYPPVRRLVHGDAPAVASFTAPAKVLAGIVAEAAEVLDTAVSAKLDATLADKDDPRPDRDKRSDVKSKAGYGMFVRVGPVGIQDQAAEVLAFDPWTGEDLGQWTVTGVADGEPCVHALDPALLLALIPGDGDVTVHLPARYKPTRVTAGAWEGVIAPLKLDPPVREKETAGV